MIDITQRGTQTVETSKPECQTAGYEMVDGVLVCKACRRPADQIFGDGAYSETEGEAK